MSIYAADIWALWNRFSVRQVDILRPAKWARWVTSWVITVPPAAARNSFQALPLLFDVCSASCSPQPQRCIYFQQHVQSFCSRTLPNLHNRCSTHHLQVAVNIHKAAEQPVEAGLACHSFSLIHNDRALRAPAENTEGVIKCCHGETLARSESGAVWGAVRQLAQCQTLMAM